MGPGRSGRGRWCVRAAVSRSLHDAKWDLDHDDANPRRYLGPSHRRCNRASVTHLKAALAPEVQRHSREW